MHRLPMFIVLLSILSTGAPSLLQAQEAESKIESLLRSSRGMQGPSFWEHFTPTVRQAVRQATEVRQELLGGVNLLLRVHPEQLQQLAENREIEPGRIVQSIAEQVAERLRLTGWQSKPRVETQGKDRIRVRLTGLTTTERRSIESLLTLRGRLYFYIVSDQEKAERRNRQDDPPPETHWAKVGRTTATDLTTDRLLRTDAESKFSGRGLERIGLTRDLEISRTPLPFFQFQDARKSEFEAFTRSHIGQTLAIVLDSWVVSALPLRKPFQRH